MSSHAFKFNYVCAISANYKPAVKIQSNLYLNPSFDPILSLKSLIKTTLSNTSIVYLFFLYNFYFGQISSCCAKILVLGAPKLNLFCPKNRRFRVWKPEVPVLLCFTYSGAHTGDATRRRAGEALTA